MIFFFQAEDGIRDGHVTGVQTCALPIFQQIHPDLKGKKVAIIGDISHSRVVRSNIIGLKKLGAEVAVCGPKTLMPAFVDHLGVEVSYNLEEVLAWCDMAMALRIQLERIGAVTDLFPSLREYHELFGIK